MHKSITTQRVRDKNSFNNVLDRVASKSISQAFQKIYNARRQNLLRDNFCGAGGHVIQLLKNSCVHAHIHHL